MILPSPASTFDWVQHAGGPALVCRPLAAYAPHVFTTRHWALGSPAVRPEDGGVPARRGEPVADEESACWRDVAEALQTDVRRLVRVRQVHGAEVAVARAGIDTRQDADILVSDDPQFGLAIRTADCVPMLIADRRTGAVAAAHAGWRGLAAGVPAITVAALARECGSRAADLLVATGPSIGACCYEVGPEVRVSFSEAGFAAADLDRWFLGAPTGNHANPPMPGLVGRPRDRHWFFDGWAAAFDQLVAAGVSPDSIFPAALCTASHPGAFCSYRRDGVGAGRLASAIRSSADRSGRRP